MCHKLSHDSRFFISQHFDEGTDSLLLHVQKDKTYGRTTHCQPGIHTKIVGVAIGFQSRLAMCFYSFSRLGLISS